MTLGERIDALIPLRHEIRMREKELTQLKENFEDAQRDVLAALDEAGSTGFKAQLGNAFVTTQDVVNIEDFDAFWNYVRENDAPHLLHRRVAVRAALELDEDIPGLKREEVRKLGLKTL
jgi:hypothetical protein